MRSHATPQELLARAAAKRPARVISSQMVGIFWLDEAITGPSGPEFERVPCIWPSMAGQGSNFRAVSPATGEGPVVVGMDRLHPILGPPRLLRRPTATGLWRRMPSFGPLRRASVRAVGSVTLGRRLLSSAVVKAKPTPHRHPDGEGCVCFVRDVLGASRTKLQMKAATP